MLIFLQFTLTNIRGLNQNVDELLHKPTWPLPDPTQFVRGTGKIRPRRKKGLRSWVHEGYLCDVKKGLSAPTIYPGAEIQLKNVYRNFYSGDEQVLNRYEFVFRTSKIEAKVSDYHINQILGILAKTTLNIRLAGLQHSQSLFAISSNLRKFYRASSTFKAKQSAVQSLSDIKFCVPQIYLLLDEGEEVDEQTISLESISGPDKNYRLFTSWYEQAGQDFRLWLHERAAESAPEVHRQLRISVQRIFSEHCCLKHVFASMNSGKIATIRGTKESDRLQSYFNTAISTFLKEEKRLHPSNELTGLSDEFSKIFDNFQPGELELLRQKILASDFRPAILDKTKIIMSNYTFNNSQIGAAGDQASSNNATFNQQTNSLPENTDYAVLATELKKLTDFLSAEAKTEEQQAAVTSITQAQLAAEQKDGNSLLHYVKEGGKWVFDTAVKIGVPVLSAIVKEQIGMH